MRGKLLEHYERELGYMRQLGAEFATKYPAVAGRLLLEPDRCADPHVERLIEAFSFLAARIHLRLDDDFPELTQGFLDVVYPHYLRPIPSMTIIEFLADESSVNGGSDGLIPAGTELTSKHTVNGVSSTFRTGYPVSLWPLRIEQCSWRRPEQIPSPLRVRDAASVLRIELKTDSDIVLTKLALNELVFYLSGERGVTLTLYEMLSRNLIEIVVRNPLRPEIHPVSLNKRRLQPAGFTPEEGLLPYTARSFQGHRILQEYFSFPEKFLFFRMSGLHDAMEAIHASDCLEILLYLRQPEQTARVHGLETSVSADTLRLFCTPAINLFERTAEPIVLTHTKTEYPISVDARSRGNVEVFSIESVLATNPSRRTAVNLPPLFENRFQGSKEAGGVYWKSTRRYSHLQPSHPSDIYLSTVDRHGVMMQPNAEILGVKCICTNHNLPSMIPVGSAEGDFYMPGAAGGGRIQALHRPTPSYAAPIGEGQTWNLISLLSLNHLSLGEAGLGALQEILRLHDFTRSPQLEKQIGGILNLQTQRHVAVMHGEFGSAAVKGMRVEMELDESHFPDGTAYLFSAVLDRFFGLYTSMNSFSQLVVRTDARKEVLGEWPPRAGTQTLL